MKKVKKFFENGRTMLEMLAVLAIIASIGIGISAGINHGLMIYRASVLKTQLPQIQKAVENTYSFISGDRKYANVGYATQDQYEDMFGDIFGKNACAENEDKKGCKTAAGHMQIFPILNGLGFKTRIYDMPRDICLELLDSIRNEGGALYAKGLIMSNPCNKDSKQTVEFASLPADFSNMDETGEACPGNQIYDPDAVGDDPKCICLHPDAIGEECLLPENETHDNDNNSGVVSSDTTTTTTAVQYTSKDEDEASTVISTSLEHTAATNASMVYNSDAGTTTSPTTTVATETTTPYATEPTSYVPETTTAGMTTQTPTMTPTTTATTAPLTTTNNGVANVGDGNTTAILAITTAEPTTTAGMTTQTPTMTLTTTATPTTTITTEPTTTGATTTATQTATATPTTTMTTEPTTTRSLETTTPYATQPASYVPETTTVK